MATRLSASLHYAAISDSVIFLDLAKDRYFQVTGQLAGDFRDWLGDRCDLEATDRLMKNHIIELCPVWQPRGTEPVKPPSSSLVEVDLPQVSALLVLEAVVTQLWARRRLRNLPIETIVKRLENRSAACETADRAVYLRTAAAFQKARRFVRYEDQCLSRSLAMITMLHRRYASAQLLIGVTLPFSAHCWVQHGDQTLTDPLDAVLLFSPILRVGRS